MQAVEWLRVKEVTIAPNSIFHLTVTRWREGKSNWLAVELNGSCLCEFPERKLQEAFAYFDGVIAGIAVGAEERER